MGLWDWTENPLFRYHLRARALLGRPFWQVALITGGFLFLYPRLLIFVSREGGVSLFLMIESLILWLITPLMTHAVFAMEFEKATWDMLVLTRLTAGQIVIGKLLSRLVVLGILALFFQPLLALATFVDYPGWQGWSLWLKTQWVIIGWSFLLMAVTLCFSYWLKRGLAAAAVTFTGQVFVLFVLPVLWMVFMAFLSRIMGQEIPDIFTMQFEGAWLRWGWLIDPRFFVIFYNPIFALITLFILLMEPQRSPFLWGTVQGAFYLILSVFLIALLIHSVAKATRKPL